MQSQGVVGVQYHECLGEGEREEQEVFPRICPEEGQTGRGLCQVVYPTPHAGDVIHSGPSGQLISRVS